MKKWKVTYRSFGSDKDETKEVTANTEKDADLMVQRGAWLAGKAVKILDVKHTGFSGA